MHFLPVCFSSNTWNDTAVPMAGFKRRTLVLVEVESAQARLEGFGTLTVNGLFSETSVSATFQDKSMPSMYRP